MILGNGRIGKTQIANRLRARPYQQQADSTHGIQTVQAPIPGRDGGVFNLWDFGGQDIYHGTHALFLKSHAVFMLVWTPDSENAETHKHNGMEFRNQRLPWWLDYVRRFGNSRSPLIVVQNQLDRFPDRGEHEAVRPVRDKIAFCRSLAYSAETDEGRGALDAYLSSAAKQFNPPLIGPGRLEVMRKLQNLKAHDAERAPQDRRHQTLPMAEFEAMCAQAQTGDISNPKQFLSFLHNAGVVFWREHLFRDQLILDQNWVLEAIYTVLDRERCLTYLKQKKGRFTRSDLALLSWDQAGYSEEEQQLFISFMLSCGICFTHEEGEGEFESEYIAPDLLPETWGGHNRARHWGAAPHDAERVFTYDALAPALMRNLICAIGGEAGVSGDYWRNGLCVFEKETDAHALIEQSLKDDWTGDITLRTRGRGAEQLMQMMVKELETQEQRLGLSHQEPEASKAAHQRPEVEEPEQHKLSTPQATYTRKPRQEVKTYVSYAHKDYERRPGDTEPSFIDQLCNQARESGMEILRDTECITIGESFKDFMKELSQGDRVVLLISDAYLHSPYCVYELYETWKFSRSEGDTFRQRVRVFTHKDADIRSVLGRAKYAEYWHQEFKQMHDYVKADPDRLLRMSAASKITYTTMGKYANEIDDILSEVAVTLKPRTIEQLVQYTLEDHFKN